MGTGSFPGVKSVESTKLGPTQPPIQWVPGLSRGVKWPGRGAEHPPHLALRLKKEYSYTSTPLSGPSWPLLGKTLLLFTFPFTTSVRNSVCIKVYERLHASAAKQMTAAFFWFITQRVLVIPYRCFGTTYRSRNVAT